MSRSGCLSCSDGRLSRTNNSYLVPGHTRYTWITAHISKRASTITIWRIQLKWKVADCLDWQSPGAYYDRINKYWTWHCWLHRCWRHWCFWAWSWVHSKFCIYCYRFICRGGCLSCSDGRLSRTNNGYLSIRGHGRHTGVIACIRKRASTITNWISQFKRGVADSLVWQNPGACYNRIN